MKICFMGTPNFAVPTLQRLIESRHEVVLVVTQPSKPKGRGMQITDPPVKVLADQNHLPVLQPASLKKEPLDDTIRKLHVDVIVVVAYGKILPESLLNAPKLGCLNVHASLLPEYRGASPIQRALIDGRLETGVTIIKLVPEMDAGPIVAHEKIEIHEDDDARSLSHILSVVGAELLIRVLEDVEQEGIIEGEEQDETLVTYAPLITKSEGEIPWSATSEEIMHRLRGLTPWPGLFTNLGSKKMRMIDAEPLDSEEAEHNGAVNDLDPGTVSTIMKGFGFAVKTGDGHLLIRKLQLEGKAATDADAFLNGFPIKVGDRLGEHRED